MEYDEGGERKEKRKNESPELKANLLSIVTWHWFNPFINLGNHKIIQNEDLYDLNPHERTEYCLERWHNAIEKERKKSDVPSVARLLWVCHRKELLYSLLCRPVGLTSAILQVFMFKEIMQSVEKKGNSSWWWDLLLILGMALSGVISSISLQMCFTITQKIGMKIQGTIAMAVFNKILSMKLVALTQTNSGITLNIIMNDTQKLQDATQFLTFAIFSVVEIMTVGTLAIIEAGVSTIPGVAIIFMTLPLQMWMARMVARFRSRALEYIDSRVRLVGEVLNGIRAVKYNGWIPIFQKCIEDIRKDEVHHIKRASFVKASTSTIKDVMSPVACLVTFGTYMIIHKGQFILPSKAFTVLALFNILVKTFNIAPLGIQYAGEGIVAIQRLQRFLNLPDGSYLKDEEDIDKVQSYKTNHEDCAVIFSDCCFSWELRAGNLTKIKSEDVQLGDSKISPHEGDVLCSVNLVVKKGEFISVVGPVGSGKTSLLYGILGEIQTLHGKKFVRRTVAYVPQNPWILNASVLRNIILTNYFDKQRYSEIVSACALELDISQLPAGHHTEIGERGVNLSGGQKARISLARACYSFAEVVILDDPLAAVDNQTAKHLIQHVLYGTLKNRTVILVTHNEAALELSHGVYTIENKKLQIEPKKLPDKKAIQQEETSDEEKIGLESSIDRRYMGDTIISTVHNQDIKMENTMSYSIKDRDHQLKQNAAQEKKTGFRPDHTKDQDRSEGRLTVKEDRVEGNVKVSTLIAYMKEARGFLFFSLILAFFGVAQSVRVMVDYWLGVWTQKKYNLKPGLYVGVYAIFTFSTVLLSFSRSFLFVDATMVATTRLHSKMIEKVLYSPQLFFDQNTVGRIVNRVSKDQSVVDEILPFSAKQTMEFVLGIVGNVAMIAVFIPWFLLSIPPFVMGLFYFQRRYLTVSQELKRVSGLSRSPIYAYFSQALQGTVSIRAYRIETKARQEFLTLLDANNQAYIHYVHATRWLGIRLDLVASIVVCATSLLVVLFRISLGPGLAGAVLIQALQMTTFFQFGIRLLADLQNNFTSVERIHGYTLLPTEASPKTDPGIIENDWPSKGQIEFINYTMAYRNDLPPVLNRIYFKVYAKEKIGILGRTGAGKSSIAVALFRMVENSKCSGDILIDGINIKSVGLQDLRKRLSIIPQDPVLFRGTLRFNLDPFQSYTDVEIWEALSKVQMTGKFHSLEVKGLDSVVAENGENFSVGERQLLCLARSLLRRSRIIVMDEATASVDGKTDGLIQTTIRTVLRDCTVLTIAHRIDTVIDCDRVLTLANGGYIAEFDSPANLLRQAEEWGNGRGVFASMVAEAGAIMAQRLSNAAEAAEKNRVQLQD